MANNNTDSEIKRYFTDQLKKVIKKKNLSRAETKQCLILLLDHKFNNANDVCFGAFFAALQTKEPTIDEVAGLMDAVIDYDRKPIEIERKFATPLCGIIGSGKDDLKTFNISSISSIVAAAAGVKVMKNGSRAEASVAGTTDVFEKLGVNVLLCDAKKLEHSINNLNFGFCDAQPYFPKMVKEYLGKYYFVHPLSYILPVASGLKFDRVIFGLADEDTEFTANLLIALGYVNSMVVAGRDLSGNSLDEISTIGPTKITEIKNGKFETYEVVPSDFDLDKASYNDIKEGSTIDENAAIFRSIISGVEKGPKRDIVLVNSGSVIYISGLARSIKEGITLAAKAIDSGAANKLLNDFIKFFQ